MDNFLCKKVELVKMNIILSYICIQFVEHCGYKSLLGFCLLSVKLFYPLVINHEIVFRLFFYFSFVNKENSLHFISLQSISNQMLIPNIYTIYIYM